MVGGVILVCSGYALTNGGLPVFLISDAPFDPGYGVPGVRSRQLGQRLSHLDSAGALAGVPCTDKQQSFAFVGQNNADALQTRETLRIYQSTTEVGII
jgi:hypothetical protein